MNNTEVLVLGNEWQGSAAKMHGAVWTEDHDRRFGGTNTKGKPPAKTQGVHSIEGLLAGRLARRPRPHGVGIRAGRGQSPATEAWRVVAQLSERKSNRSGERTLPCAMPNGWEAESPMRTWDSVPQRKLASKCQRVVSSPGRSWRPDWRCSQQVSGTS